MECKYDVVSDAGGASCVRLRFLRTQKKGSTNEHFVSSFLTGPEPVDLVVSAPLPDAWYGSLADSAKYAKSVKLYCSTTRVLNAPVASLAQAAVGLQPPPPPLFQPAVPLDVAADVRAMKQASEHVYVYAGLTDSRQKTPSFYSLFEIQKFVDPLKSLGKTWVPVLRKVLRRMSDECSVDDPLVRRFGEETAKKVEALESKSKRQWLTYLLEKCPDCPVATVLADFAADNPGINVVLVPSMRYFVNNFTGCGRPLDERVSTSIQLKFGGLLMNTNVTGSQNYRLGSQNTVHITTKSDKTEVVVFAAGGLERIVVDGAELKVDECRSGPLQDFKATPLQGCGDWGDFIKTWGRLPFDVVRLAKDANKIARYKEKMGLRKARIKARGIMVAYIDIMCEKCERDATSTLDQLANRLPGILKKYLDEVYNDPLSQRPIQSPTIGRMLSTVY